MSFYAAVTGLTTLSYLTLGVIVFFKNPKGELYQRFLIFCSAVAFWALGYFITLLPNIDGTIALISSRTSHAIGAFIPVTFFHFTLIFLDRSGAYRRKLLAGGYLLSCAMSLACFTPLVVRSVYPKMGIPHYPEWGIFYPAYAGLYVLYALCLSQFEMARSFFRLHGMQKKRLIFFIASTAAGFIGGISLFLLIFNLPIPPYASVLIIVFPFAMAYTIIKYREFDIEVIIKKTLVFAGLFGVLMTVVAIVTALTQSYIGQYLKMGESFGSIVSVLIAIVLFDPTRKLLVNLTDKFLFQRKYDYHKLLKDASRGMSNIESLERLLGLVVHFITMKMRVRNAAVLMREGTSDQYHLVYQRGFDKKFLTLTLYENDPLIHYLESHKEAVDIERIKEQVEGASHQRDKSEKAYDYEAIRERMNQLQASCCVPSFLGRELRNILMLGEKKSGEYYSNEDLNLLYTLAQESSIAIENARLYDEALRKSHELEHINEQLEYSKELLMKALQEAEGANKQLQDTQAQLIHEQKMATLGRLAASVGHEVNNPLTILSMNVSRVILKHRKNKDMKVTEILDVFDKMEKNIERIKAVVNTLTGLLKKSEKGKFEPLSLKLILEETLPLVQFQTYLDNLSGTEVDFNVPGNVPLIRGDLERLQEVFLNLFINAYHAMAGKRHRKIGVQAEIDPKDPGMVAIHFRDNGSGMTEEIMKRVFNYGFTTKPPGKGSGLGLYMCKYIIELHGGTITVTSKLGEGTTFTLTLPIYSETPALK